MCAVFMFSETFTLTYISVSDEFTNIFDPPNARSFHFLCSCSLKNATILYCNSGSITVTANEQFVEQYATMAKTYAKIENQICNQ